MKSSIHKIKNHITKEYARLAPHYDRRWAFFNEATLLNEVRNHAISQTGRLDGWVQASILPFFQPITQSRFKFGQVDFI